MPKKETKRRREISSQMRQVSAILSRRYGDFNHYNRKNPLDELLFILCSTLTDEPKYRASHRALKTAFPRFSLIARSPSKAIAKVIAPAGLSARKSKAIKGIMAAVNARFGEFSLSPLRHANDSECEAFLTSLPGVGKKVARCVMMYSFGRTVFPVDTHCWRIARRLGWIRPTRPGGICSGGDMDRLQGKIPPHLRHSLHVNMISLGRDICLAREPLCLRCPLLRLCPQVGVSKFCPARSGR